LYKSHGSTSYGLEKSVFCSITTVDVDVVVVVIELDDEVKELLVSLVTDFVIDDVDSKVFSVTASISPDIVGVIEGTVSEGIDVRSID